MIRLFILAILILCMAMSLVAQDGDLSREELQHRRAELNAQAEQIKRATRFQGRISVSPERNRITWLEGMFRDITFPAMEDTLGIERTFDEIVDRIIPFFPVNREDLRMINLNIRENMIGTDYRQTANGYRIEGGASLIITYTTRGGSVYINNSLTYLDPSVLPTEPRITKEEVIRMFYDNLDIPERERDDDRYRLWFKIMYLRLPEERHITPPRYRLVWSGAGGDHIMAVDAVTGEILWLQESPTVENTYDGNIE